MSFMVKIKEVDEWDKILKAGGKYYFTRYAASCLVDLAITTYDLRIPKHSRNQCAILAFTLPQKWKAGTGVSIVATHIDSPNLRVR